MQGKDLKFLIYSTGLCLEKNHGSHGSGAHQSGPINLHHTNTLLYAID